MNFVSEQYRIRKWDTLQMFLYWAQYKCHEKNYHTAVRLLLTTIMDEKS